MQLSNYTEYLHRAAPKPEKPTHDTKIIYATPKKCLDHHHHKPIYLEKKNKNNTSHTLIISYAQPSRFGPQKHTAAAVAQLEPFACDRLCVRSTMAEYDLRAKVGFCLFFWPFFIRLFKRFLSVFWEIFSAFYVCFLFDLF